MPNFIPADVNITMAIIAVGGALAGNEFRVRLYPESGADAITATNDASGLVTFNAVNFTSIGAYNFTARAENSMDDTSAVWIIDDTEEWPVVVDVYEAGNALQALVSYPNGVPTFTATRQGTTCGLFEFPELVFTSAGVYEYTLQELTPSGGGWTVDDGIIRVVVTVVDDGHGNLVATVSYPDGFPSFENRYNADPARIVISGCKTAVGAQLPAGRFVFGLYDYAGNLISSVTNNSAGETIPEDELEPELDG